MPRKRRDYILPAWVGPVVHNVPVDPDAPVWRRCTHCKRRTLTRPSYGKTLCLACDPTKIEVQPGVYVNR